MRNRNTNFLSSPISLLPWLVPSKPLASPPVERLQGSSSPPRYLISSYHHVFIKVNCLFLFINGCFFLKFNCNLGFLYARAFDLTFLKVNFRFLLTKKGFFKFKCNLGFSYARVSDCANFLIQLHIPVDKHRDFQIHVQFTGFLC